MKNFLKHNLMSESTKMQIFIYMGKVEWKLEFYNMDSSNENY
jgi:hypothetical protein